MAQKPPHNPQHRQQADLPDTHTAVSAAMDAVGDRLRDFRQRRGLTLTDVAETLGVSASTLSRLESGGRRPTLDLLMHLAHLYRVPLDALVGAPATGDPRIHPRPIKRGDRVMVPLTGPGAPVQAIKMIIPGRPANLTVVPQRHGGYEWFYVLSGSVELTLGEETLTIDKGQAAEFDTHTPHAIHSATEHPAEVLSLFSAQGERIHVHGE